MLVVVTEGQPSCMINAATPERGGLRCRIGTVHGFTPDRRRERLWWAAYVRTRQTTRRIFIPRGTFIPRGVFTSPRAKHREALRA